jgi:hypothetical protein
MRTSRQRNGEKERKGIDRTEKLTIVTLEIKSEENSTEGSLVVKNILLDPEWSANLCIQLKEKQTYVNAGEKSIS